MIAKRRVGAAMCAALLFLFTFLLCYFQIFRTHDWGDDFAQYIAQARAIAEGSEDAFVEANSFIVLHSPVQMATPVYPWGYPLLLAPVYALFGLRITAYKVVQSLLIAACVSVFYLLLRRRFRPGYALVGSFALAANQTLLIYANYVQSEPFFLLLVLLCFYVLTFTETCAADRELILPATLFGLLASAAYFCRSQGICLFLALFVCGLIRRIRLPQRLRAGFTFPLETQKSHGVCSGILVRLLPYAIFCAAFLLMRFLLPAGDRSQLYFLDSLTWRQIGLNIRLYAVLLTDMLPFPAAKVGYLVLCALAVVGLLFQKQKDLFVLVFAMGLYATGILFPWAQGVRYVLYAFPVLIIYALYGISFLLEKVAVPKAVCVALGLAACALFSYRAVFKSIQNMQLHREFDAGAYSEDAKDAYRYIRQHTPEDATIVFFKPRLLWLETGRLSYRVDGEAEKLMDADYLLSTGDAPVQEWDWDALQASIAAYNRDGGTIEYGEVYENDRFTLYKIDTTAP